MKKQHIEDIFSSMENFSSVPPPELWDAIEEKLHQPKKKKAAVIWWSIAASLLVGLSIPSVLYFNSSSESSSTNGTILPNNSVVIENNNHNSDKNKNVSNDTNVLQETIKPNKNKDINIVSSEEEKSIKSKSAPGSVISNQNRTNGIVSNSEKNWNKKTKNNQILNSKEVRNPNRYNENQYFKNKQENVAYQNAVASKNKKADSDKTLNKDLNSKLNQNSPNGIFNSKFTKNEETVAFGSKNHDIKNAFNSKNNNSLIPSKAIENNTNIFDKINSKSQTETSTSERAFAINTENKSKSESGLTAKDSVQLAELQNLEKAVAVSKTTKDEETTTVSNAEKWSLEVFAGVANSENISKDKTLGNANQSKQTNTYGVKTNYKLNKKWAVSSGLKINELGQSVANVSYYNNPKVSSFPTTSDYLNHSVAVTIPQITNNSSYVFVSNNTANSLKSENLSTGNIDQSLRYIEMPLEVSYALFNKNKTSISLNTGGFVGKLISNRVSLDGNSIGSNLEANDFVYGSLLSSTLQYRLYKKTHVFVEPGMNYYINPLNNQSFNQFQWAFNFGLNVSF